jgi:hypothetical protein
MSVTSIGLEKHISLLLNTYIMNVLNVYVCLCEYVYVNEFYSL